MSLALCEPDLPPIPLEQCSDKERKIPQKCWDLVGVQKALAAGQLKLITAPAAARDQVVQLAWSAQDLMNFIMTLSAARYNDSEWGLPSGNNGQIPPMKLDSYLMGFNRFKGEENQKTNPWVYIKFTVTQGNLLVLRLHPSNFD